MNLKNISHNKEKVPLSYAIIKGNIEIVKFLLTHWNIDINVKCLVNGEEKRLLDIAILKGEPEIISPIKNFR